MNLDRGSLDDTLAAMFSNPVYRTDYLFYAHLIGQCSIKIDTNLPAPAGVCFMHEHYNLYINPEQYDVFSLPERLAILKHEMLHILYGHINRLEERDFKKWNLSTDCALNQHINHEHLPDCAITPETLSEMREIDIPKNESAEFYYQMLSDSSDSDHSKTSMDSHETWKLSSGDKDLQKDITKKMTEHAQTETIKCAGTVPNECSNWLQLHSTKSEFNWKRVLRGIIGNKKIGKRTTIQRRDRRFPHREELRGKIKNRTFNLLLVADVSGSMSDSAVLSTFAEVRHICDVTKTNLDLIQIDTVAYEPEKLTKTTKLITRKGNGGTELGSALQKAKEHNIDYQAIVVLTDGHLFGDDIAQFKGTKKRVIWLIEKNGQIHPDMQQQRMKAYKLSNE